MLSPPPYVCLSLTPTAARSSTAVCSFAACGIHQFRSGRGANTNQEQLNSMDKGLLDVGTRLEGFDSKPRENSLQQPTALYMLCRCCSPARYCCCTAVVVAECEDSLLRLYSSLLSPTRAFVAQLAVFRARVEAIFIWRCLIENSRPGVLRLCKRNTTRRRSASFRDMPTTCGLNSSVPHDGCRVPLLINHGNVLRNYDTRILL